MRYQSINEVYQTFSSSRKAIVVVIVISVLIRIGLALFLGDQAEPVSGAFDQVSYDALATRVLAGNGFSFPIGWYPFTNANEPTAHWSFLYTLYLAGVYGLFGHHPLAARLIQVVFSGLQCWLTYRIGQRLFGEWVGVVAAVLTAGYAYFIFFNAALMTQTFYILALLATLDIATDLGSHPDPDWRKWIALGAAMGIGTLMRQTLLPFAPLLLVWLGWVTRRALRGADARHATRPLATPRGPVPIPIRFTRLLIPLIVIALFVAPWTIRNYLVYHDFLLLNSNSGFWFYSSNHPNQGTSFNGNYVAPIPDELEGLNEPAIDRELFREGIGFILADPQRFLLLTWSRFGAYFWIAPTEGSTLISNVARLFSFALYVPFMLYGLWLSRRNWRACLPLYLYVAFDSGLCLISWSAPRYRLPSDALMMLFAGLAVSDLATRLKIPARIQNRWGIGIEI